MCDWRLLARTCELQTRPASHARSKLGSRRCVLVAQRASSRQCLPAVGSESCRTLPSRGQCECRRAPCATACGTRSSVRGAQRERDTRHHRRGGEQVHSNASDTALARHARPVADASDVAGCDGVSAGWARDARSDDGPDRKPRCDESISSKTLCNAGVSGLWRATRGRRDAPDELCLAARSAGCVRAGRAGVDCRTHELSLQEGTQVLPELCSRSAQPV